MSQGEVIKCLEKADKPLSRTEIANILGENPCKISVIISKLLKFGEIKAIEIDRFEAEKRYHVKRKMCIYCL